MKPTKRPKATADAILDAARRIARERGWPAVTIRAVADALGYASPLLYEHFANKDALFAAATRQGFDLLEADLRTVEGKGEPRIVAMGEAYVAFAQREPELYRVMHGLDGAVTDPSAIATGATRVCEVVMEALIQWAHDENVTLEDPLAATETLWCLAHGIASLALVGRLEDGRIAAAAQTLLAGWRNGA